MPTLDNHSTMTTLLPMKITSYLTVAILAGILLCGCTTVEREFLGSPSDQVWTAMVAVANSPDYDEWTVTQNDVWVDPTSQRIEIYRRMRRIVHQPAYKARRENREWRFQVIFEPPVAIFTSRGMGVPAHAQEEAEHFFDDVLNLLGGIPVASDDPNSGSIDSPDN